MRVRAFLDANVLYRSITRSVLVTLGELDAFQPLWSDQVNDEWMRNLQTNRPDLDPRRIARTRALMDQYVNEARVTGFEPLIDTLVLPDPKDRHVLAAAIHSHADVIVTWNSRDFPPATLAQFNIIAMTADDFLMRLLGDEPDQVIVALTVDRKHMLNPPLDADAYLTALERDGLGATAAALRPMADRL